MNTLPSSNVRIFPASNRSTESQQFGTNFVTEYNLSSIINKLMYNGEVKTVNLGLVEEYTVRGFLISDSEDDNPFEFNIGGYFVSISGETQTNNTDDNEDDTDNTAKNGIELIIKYLTNSGTDTKDEDFVKFICITSGPSNGVVYAYIDILQDENAEESFRYVNGTDVDATGNNVDNAVTRYALPLFNVSIKTSGDTTTYSLSSLYWQSQLRLTNFAIDDGDLDK